MKFNFRIYQSKWADKSTTSYDMLDFKSDIKICNGHIGQLTLLIAKVCLGFATYNIQLPDIYLAYIFYINF